MSSIEVTLHPDFIMEIWFLEILTIPAIPGSKMAPLSLLKAVLAASLCSQAEGRSVMTNKK